MEADATLVTRQQCIEMLVEASCWEASELGSGFMSWCEWHVPPGGTLVMTKLDSPTH